MYVLTYYKVTFDPKEKTLECDEQVSFNKAVLREKILLEDRPKASYILESINMRIEDFLSESVQKRIEIVQDALNMQGTFRQVKIDTQPKIMILENCNNKVDLSVTYGTIEEKIKNNTQAEPLQSFFGRETCQEYKEREPSIMMLDEKVNTSQMRVIYNAMKNPVTFVQGPPGTGKTQTIINVILSAFYNDKTVLVCSANNNPVDGIVNQLRYDEYNQGKLRYKDRNIAFPILRLGNEQVMKDAIQYILQMYNYNYHQSPIPEKLKDIKEQNDSENSELIKNLCQQEILEETVENINRAEKLRTIFTGVWQQEVIDKLKNLLILPLYKSTNLSQVYQNC